MQFNVLVNCLWNDGYHKAGSMIDLPEDPCRPDLFEGSASDKGAANEKAKLVAKVVAAKKAFKAVAERYSLERLKAVCAEIDAEAKADAETAKKKAELVKKLIAKGIPKAEAEAMPLEELIAKANEK